MNSNKRPIRKGAPKWMVTFSDLMMLILVFFVLLFASSHLDATKLDALLDSFRQRNVFEFYPSAVPLEHRHASMNEIDIEDFGKNPLQSILEQEDEEQQSEMDVDEQAEIEEDELDEVLIQILQYIEEHDLGEVMWATREQRGVELVLQDNILFPSGEAIFLPEAEPLLEQISGLLEEIPNFVEVEGHTDNVPISTSIHPSNWELSGARASRVVRYFVEDNGLDPNRFITVGYGEYLPIDTNQTEEGRQRNRRVVIVILDPDHDPTNRQSGDVAVGSNE